MAQPLKHPISTLALYGALQMYYYYYYYYYFNLLICECNVREIEETWASSKFVVTKYVKGNVDRGYTVGGVDEVVQVLDDNCMQLQGMAGSRFVGPFLNTVQRWEQTLSLISEVGHHTDTTTLSPQVIAVVGFEKWSGHRKGVFGVSPR